MKQPELITDERYATQRARAARVKEVNKIVEDWAADFTAAEIETRLIAAEVPVSKVFTMEDIFQDPHFEEREMLVKVPHPKLGELTMMGIVPKLSDTPGKIRHAGHVVGQDTAEVLQRKLGMNMEEIADLSKHGIVHTNIET
jgi:crotonobetainyl-CoA:carnitine CoA-transferase CaiB-like acyl-CoA transferase